MSDQNVFHPRTDTPSYVPSTSTPVTTYVPSSPAPAVPVPPSPSAAVPSNAAAPVVAPPSAAPSERRAALRQGANRPMMVGHEPGDLDLDAVLAELVQRGGSDLHLTINACPTIRVNGDLEALEQFGVLAADPLRRLVYAILSQKQRERFEENLELDLSYAVRNLARFRVNVYQQREALGAVFRVIPYEIKPLEQLGVPPVVATFAGLPRGLVLVTGPTGSGKTTTLASLLDLANRTRPDHIMTVEDPIEFLHRHKRALVNQREVGEDTRSFAAALKHVLRQDPDIILVGEMRDLETISVALTAAETGHLVLATLHTQDAAQTVDRMIDVFPPAQQDQVRVQLAGTLQGILCQTLVKRTDVAGRVLAAEVLVATPAIRNLIREGKSHQMYSSMQAGAQHGMQTLDQHLAEHVRAGRITFEVGLENASQVEDFTRLCGRSTAMSQGSNVMSAQFTGSDAYGKARF